MSNENKTPASESEKPGAAKQEKTEKQDQGAPSPEKERALDTQSEFSRAELLRNKK